MQFYDYRTHYQLAKANPGAPRFLKNLSPREFFVGYTGLLADKSMEMTGKPLHLVDPLTPSLLQMETDWHETERPYYNLWPSIIPALLKLRLDADASFFQPPLGVLLLRFPIDGNPLVWTDRGQEWRVRTVLCGNASLVRGSGRDRQGWVKGDYLTNPEQFVRGISMWLDIHEPLEEGEGDEYVGSTYKKHQLHRMMYKHLVCEEGRTIEWSFDNIPPHDSADIGVQYPDHIVRDVARIVCTLCLMAEDKDLVEPIVLKADEDKFERTGDLGLVSKAIRRGNFGFNVGRNIEVMPHVRAASPAALYWVGQGRKIPRIRFRRGTVVHRKRLAQVPTGFLDKEKSE